MSLFRLIYLKKDIIQAALLILLKNLKDSWIILIEIFLLFLELINLYYQIALLDLFIKEADHFNAWLS